jgi:hypothetical protein
VKIHLLLDINGEIEIVEEARAYNGCGELVLVGGVSSAEKEEGCAQEHGHNVAPRVDRLFHTHLVVHHLLGVDDQLNFVRFNKIQVNLNLSTPCPEAVK